MSTKTKFVKPKNLDLAVLASEEVYYLFGRCNKEGSKDQKLWKFKAYKTKNLVKHFPKCYYFINNLITRNDREHKGDRSVYTNLSQEILKEGIPESTYDTCVSLLYALNVIECDGKYVHSQGRRKDPLTGKLEKAKCYGYRLTELYRGETVTIQADERILSKKQRSAQKKSRKLILTYPAFQYQYDLFLSNNYSIADGAFEDVKVLLGKVDYKGDVITQEHIDEMIEDFEILAQGSVEEFRPDDWGRLQTTVGHMKRESRSFINGIDAKPLVQLDFKSSYTFHLIKLIREEKGINVFKNIVGRVPQYVPTFFDELEGEVRFLHDKCMNEGLYEYILDEYEATYGTALSNNRDESIQMAKDSWNHSFLNTKSCKNSLSLLIRRLFPRINEFIEEWGRYKIWIALMRSEANLVHHHIIGRIKNELGMNCTLFGIHDALLVDQTSSATIRYIMEEEAANYFKFPARIKVEKLVRPQVKSQCARELALATK